MGSAGDIEDPKGLSVAIEGPRGLAVDIEDPMGLSVDIEDPMDSAVGWHKEAVAEAGAVHRTHLKGAAYMTGQVHCHRTI